MNLKQMNLKQVNLNQVNLKQIKALKSKKGRDEQGLFIVEGEKMVAEIPDYWPVRIYICSESYAQNNELTAFKSSTVATVSDSRFMSLSDTVTPQGIMAVCEKRSFGLDQLLSSTGPTSSNNSTKNPLLLIGENLSDPGNIGTLIRTAAAAGASGVVLSRGSGDIWNPKTIRASAGAILRLPIIENASLKDIITLLKQHGIIILAAHLKGEVLPYDLDLKSACGILIGNEARGLSEETAALADFCVKLPIDQGIESLNASVAGGILLYEVVRQRI